MTQDDRETLEYLCWHFAASAEMFWPFDETVHNCMDAVIENYEGRTFAEFAEGYGWERGQHIRAVDEACSLFEQLHGRGYDPVQMAKKEIERSRNDGLELEDIDWDWLRFAGLPDYYIEPYIGGDQ